MWYADTHIHLYVSHMLTCFVMNTFVFQRIYIYIIMCKEPFSQSIMWNCYSLLAKSKLWNQIALVTQDILNNIFMPQMRELNNLKLIGTYKSVQCKNISYYQYY